MRVKESLLNWLKSSSKRQHRASTVEEERIEEEEPRESQPKRETHGKAEEAEFHQESDK